MTKETDRQVGSTATEAGTDARDELRLQSANEELRQTEARLRLVIDAARDYAIFTTDSDRRITRWSQGAADIFGYPAEEAIGMCADVLWTQADRAAGQPEHEARTALVDGCATDERWHLRKDGGRVFLNGSVHPLPADEHGQAQGLIKIARDETQRRAVDDALRAANRSRDELASQRDAILRQLTEGVIVTNAEGQIVFVNRCAEQLHGVAKLDVTPDEYSETYHLFTEDGEPHPPEQLPLARAVLRGETVIDARWRIRRPDGTEILAIGSAYPLEVDGQAAGAVLTLRDDTARHAAEVALRESEARLRFLSTLDEALRGSPDAREAMSAATRLLAQRLGATRCAYADVDTDDENDRFVIRSDWSAPGVPSSSGTYSLDLFGPRAAADMRQGRTLVVRDVGTELAPGEGREMFQSIQIDAVICCPLIKHGRLVAMMAVHQDRPRKWTEKEIASVEAVVERCWAQVERVGAEARLRASEARYRTLFGSIESGFCVVEVTPEAADRTDYRVVEANPAFYRHTGFPADILGRWLREASPDLEEYWFETYSRVARSGEPERFEQGSGHLGRWFDVYAFRVGEPAERRVAILFNDISERRRVEQALRESSEEFYALADNIPLLCWIARPDGHIYWYNRRWYEYTGTSAEDQEGWGWESVHDPAWLPRVAERWKQSIATGEPFEMTFPLRGADGEFRPFLTRIVPIRNEAGEITRWFGSNVDISEQEQAKAELQRLNDTLESRVIERTAELEAAHEQLRQSQKMEAMGQLTGGVAHDFNNLLTPIVGSLDMLQRKGLGGEREQRLIGGALQSADRAKTLVQRLLAFARRQPLQSTAVDVGKLVTGMADLLASTTGPQIRVVVEAPDDLPLARADANQLEMALLNLGVNARDAMPDGGTLRISANAESVPAGHRSRLPAGDYVRLSVADTGVGMDQAVAARAIEPFFSTKGIGKGTGLGLSMVHGLVSQLGGALTIESRPGVGTNVELWLPRTQDEPKAAPVVEDIVAARGARGQVLLVDDEELVRMSTADMLAELGYSVVEASSGEAAVQLVDAGLNPDLLVTDHLMPGMSGADLAQALRARKPGLPVLIVSGYAEIDGISAELPRLTKPFRNADLAASLAVLEEPDG